MSDDRADRAPTLSVGELNRLIRYALSVTFPDDLWVEGEISSLKRHEASGHVYFQLVEAGAAGQADATLSVALYAGDRRAVNLMLKRAGGAIRMADGVHIRIRGTLDYYPARGSLQLRMRTIDPAYTLGRLTAERDRVLAALAAEGLLGANAALPFPAVPTHIGLITSDGSAAHADFMDELARSGMTWHVSLASVRVQGTGAEHEVVGALRALEARDVEVIAMVRGGGARTDLVAFDSEVLARAITTLRVPVVTGVGHEIDTSIADAVAAQAHKTPTACAAALVERARAGLVRADTAWGRITERARSRIEVADLALATHGHRVSQRTRAHLDLAERDVQDRTRRMVRSAATILDGADRRMAGHATRAGALDPARALARGWSITRTPDGEVVRDPARLRPGDALITTVAGGTVRSVVDDAEGT